MHHDDWGMIERGDMFWNRKKGNRLISMLAPILFRFGTSNRFQPDVTIEDEIDLMEMFMKKESIIRYRHSKLA